MSNEVPILSRYRHLHLKMRRIRHLSCFLLYLMTEEILLFLREICPMSFFLFDYNDFKISLFALSTMDVSNEAK